MKWISTYTNRHIIGAICFTYGSSTHSAADRGGGQQFAPGSQCTWAPKQCSTHSNTYPSLASLSNSFRCIVDFKSACMLFCFALMLLGCKPQCRHLMCLLRSLLARAQYIVLFDLKPLNEDSNLVMYVLYACTKRSTRSSQNTLYRACKISNIPGGMPPNPLTQSI